MNRVSPLLEDDEVWVNKVEQEVPVSEVSPSMSRPAEPHEFMEREKQAVFEVIGGRCSYFAMQVADDPGNIASSAA